MASGTIKGTTSNKYIASKIEWTSVKNTEENSSKVTAKLYYRRTNTGYVTSGIGDFTITINGTKKTKSDQYLEIATDWVKAMEATETVAHSDDGSKSITIKATGSLPPSTLESTSLSGTAKLDTIPRASSITSADAVELGNACGIKWTPNSASFYYKLTFSLADWSYTSEAIHPNKTSAYTYTGFVLRLADLAQIITQSNTADMTVELTTYSDSTCETSIGSTSETFTVSVPATDETRPVVTMELTPGTTPFAGLYLQGLSNVQATIRADGKLGAVIKSYSLVVEEKNYEYPYLSDKLTTAGDLVVTGCAVDSRGIAGYVDQKITVLPYNDPNVIDVEAYRCTSDKVEAEDGEYLMITATREYSSVMADGEQKNFCKIQYSYKAEIAEGFSEPVEILGETAPENKVTTGPLLNATFSKSMTYVVKVWAVDTVGRSSPASEIRIPSEEVFRHKRAGGKGLGLGGYCEMDDLLDVHWNQRVRKGLVIGDGVGSVYISVTDEDPADIFGNTWQKTENTISSAIHMWVRTE